MHHTTTVAVSPSKPLSAAIFMESIVDYAGLFPPAALSLSDAMKQYFEHRTELAKKFLARFVYPAKQLDKLPDLLKTYNVFLEPFHLSLLLEAADTAELQLAALDRAIANWTNVVLTQCPNVIIQCIEMALPKSLQDQASSEAIARQHDFLTLVENKLLGISALANSVPLFVEFSWANDPKNHCELLQSGHSRRFAKLRTGGLLPAQIPNELTLATAIHTFARAKIPMKFTAGLHEAFCHFDAAVGANVYGFLNVFFAAFGASFKEWNISQVQHCLTAPSSEHWAFNADGVQCSFQNSQVYDAIAACFFSNAEIESARGNVALSFGSCSFSEPIESLEKMGVL